VMAGFIVGFDTDDAGAVERQRAWIGRSPIPLAMVGILIALPGTQLERRLEREGRLVHESGGDNFMRTNFVTTLDEPTLLEGYARLLADIYSPAAFYARALRCMALCPVDRNRYRHPLGPGLACIARAVWHEGVRSRHRAAFWRFFGEALLQSPRRLPRAVGFAINAAHMIRYTEEEVLPRLYASVAEAVRAPRRLERANIRLPVVGAAVTESEAARS